MDERKVKLALEAFVLATNITSDQAVWTEERIPFNVRVVMRYLRRYNSLTDEERMLHERILQHAWREALALGPLGRESQGVVHDV